MGLASPTEFLYGWDRHMDKHITAPRGVVNIQPRSMCHICNPPKYREFKREAEKKKSSRNPTPNNSPESKSAKLRTGTNAGVSSGQSGPSASDTINSTPSAESISSPNKQPPSDDSLQRKSSELGVGAIPSTMGQRLSFFPSIISPSLPFAEPKSPR
ncbi:hypothetical protein M407DRAFT_99078 [Tulasnella calospora MUT 4182]|uniref:Uncharacterized protein n=1 Tax=Tulasnella calospora MUT 4182 TaxID=1051891 RepID=A0A0C3LTA9_9AGAM|nr:hypothetical protein M407DRAFT_99078 [Tulasnella calospora MUT 4182]